VLALSLLLNGVNVRIIEKELVHRTGSKANGFSVGFHPVIEDSLEAVSTAAKVGRSVSLSGVAPRYNGEVYCNATNVFLRSTGRDEGDQYEDNVGRGEPHAHLPLREHHLPWQSRFAYRLSCMRQVNFRTLGQDQLEAILRERLQRAFGIQVELRVELVSFERGAESITYRLGKRTDASSPAVDEFMTAEYLVGCDSGRSVARKQLGLSFEGETLPGRMLSGDVHVEGLDNQVNCSSAVTSVGADCLSYSTCTPGVTASSRKQGSRLCCDAHSATTCSIVLWAVSKDPEVAAAFRCVGTDVPGPEELAQDPDCGTRYIQQVSGRSELNIGKWVYLNISIQ
jgi:hypothetical protein